MLAGVLVIVVVTILNYVFMLTRGPSPVMLFCAVVLGTFFEAGMVGWRMKSLTVFTILLASAFFLIPAAVDRPSGRRSARRAVRPLGALVCPDSPSPATHTPLGGGVVWGISALLPSSAATVTIAVCFVGHPLVLVCALMLVFVTPTALLTAEVSRTVATIGIGSFAGTAIGAAIAVAIVWFFVRVRSVCTAAATGAVKHIDGSGDWCSRVRVELRYGLVHYVGVLCPTIAGDLHLAAEAHRVVDCGYATVERPVADRPRCACRVVQ